MCMNASKTPIYKRTIGKIDGGLGKLKRIMKAKATHSTIIFILLKIVGRTLFLIIL